MCSAPAAADTRDDARRVVQILINQDVVNAMIDAIEPLTRQALQQNLSKGDNAQVSPGSRDVITTLFLNEVRSRFLAAMVNEYVQIYMAELSPDELAGLRAFLETPAGQSYGEASEPRSSRLAGGYQGWPRYRRPGCQNDCPAPRDRWAKPDRQSD